MEHTARNFALQLGALIALYATVASLISLLLGAITLSLPDATDSSWQLESTSDMIRFAFATLVIVFPTYLALTRRVNVIRRKGDGAYLGLTRWLIYLSLLVGGSVLLGDAIALVNGFLNGELTLRFLLKALVLALIVGTTFGYYLLDARGYWQDHERHSLYYGFVAILIVLASLIWSFGYIETPQEVRERRIDEIQLNDLQNIQYHIDDYLMTEGTLPESIEAAYSSDFPTAPEGRAEFEYRVTDEGFALCAEFGTASRDTYDDYYSPRFEPIAEHPQIVNGYGWEHEAGWWCFEREVK